MGAEGGIGTHQRERLTDRLGDQQTIERIAVVGRQGFQPEDEGRGQGQPFETGGRGRHGCPAGSASGLLERLLDQRVGGIDRTTVLILIAGARIPRQRHLPQILALVDAVGLGAYAVVGMNLALAAGLSLPAVVLVGVVNDVGAASCGKC
jgi:hypothetical protein